VGERKVLPSEDAPNGGGGSRQFPRPSPVEWTQIPSKMLKMGGTKGDPLNMGGLESCVGGAKATGPRVTRTVLPSLAEFESI